MRSLCLLWPSLPPLLAAPLQASILAYFLPPSPPPADTPEVLASNGAGPGALSFVHVLRRCQGEKVAELVRCRTTWRAGEATSSAASSDS